MRAKTEYAQRPAEVEISRGNRYATVFLRDNIVQAAEATEDAGERWEADEYILRLPSSHNLEARITAGFAGYLSAAKQEDAARVAQQVREKRNALLTASDAMVALDRLGLEAPSGSTFTAWLAFFKKLGDALVGTWATYRQALRDLPQQEGFPYDVQWPVKPNE